MTEATPSTKQILADLIDAYATAKMSGNETLVKLSIGPLQEFLGTHDVVPVSAPSTELPAEADEK